MLMGESHGGAAALSAAALDRRVCAVLAADAFSDGGRGAGKVGGRRPAARACGAVAASTADEEALVLGEAPEVAPIEHVIPYAPDDLVLFRSLCESHPLWSRRASLATIQAIGELRPASLGGHLRDRPVRLIHGSEDGDVRYVTLMSSAPPSGQRTITLLTGLGMA